MGRDLYETYPVFREVIDNAHLDFDLRSLMFEGPDEQLSQTRYTQPCMVAFAAGMTAVLDELGIKPDYVAGLSLGEYSALAAAGVFEPQQAIQLAAFRGSAMAHAAEGRACAMVSILGVAREAVESAVELAAAAEQGTVEVSNYNCPGQTVIAGDASAVELAAAAARDAGARRCIPLHVSGPFHTSLLHAAGDALHERFKEESFGEMRVPVLFNCSGHEMGADDSIPALLERQVQSAVRMEDTIMRLGELGVDRVIEVGPGKVLSGLVRRCTKAIRCVSIETCEDVESLKEEL
ncbi:MAG: ACP S-malonyltransferase [Collinsella sp.]|nr:ACP S-malonyltransferase [Collinsella sp.]